jgi:hypothetical protein
VPDDLASGRLVQIEIDGLDPIVRRTSLVLRRGDNLELPPIRNFVWLALARYASGVWKRARSPITGDGEPQSASPLPTGA